MLVLALLFLVVPVVELYVIVQVAGSIGVLETFGLLIVISALGAWLVRREGMGVLGRIQARLAQGTMPTNELIDGGLIMFAGALMLTPGFVTDVVALLLLFPPTRAMVRSVLRRRFRGRVQVFGSGPAGPSSPGRAGRGERRFVDVTEVDDPNADPPPGTGSRGALDP